MFDGIPTDAASGGQGACGDSEMYIYLNVLFIQGSQKQLVAFLHQTLALFLPSLHEKLHDIVLVINSFDKVHIFFFW